MNVASSEYLDVPSPAEHGISPNLYRSVRAEMARARRAEQTTSTKLNEQAAYIAELEQQIADLDATYAAHVGFVRDLKRQIEDAKTDWELISATDSAHTWSDRVSQRLVDWIDGDTAKRAGEVAGKLYAEKFHDSRTSSGFTFVDGKPRYVESFAHCDNPYSMDAYLSMNEAIRLAAQGKPAFARGGVVHRKRIVNRAHRLTPKPRARVRAGLCGRVDCACDIGEHCKTIDRETQAFRSAIDLLYGLPTP